MKSIEGWAHRYELFSRFDDGIQFDKEGFESSKSEGVADFLSSRLPGTTVLDGFTGLGGSAISLAKAGKKVISVDINPDRSRMAEKNAAIYGVSRQITFIVADILQAWETVDFDAAYFDPPWGGTEYVRSPLLFFSSFKPCILPLVTELVTRKKFVGATLPLNFDLNELKQISEPVRLYFNEQFGVPYCMHCIWMEYDSPASINRAGADHRIPLAPDPTCQS